eukprot:556711_1
MSTKTSSLFILLIASYTANGDGNTYIWVDSMKNIDVTGWHGSHSGYQGDSEVRFNGGDYIYRTTNVSNYSSLYVVSNIKPWFDDVTINKNERIHLQYQINGILSNWMDVETWSNKQLPTENDVTYLPDNADHNYALTIRYWNDGTDSSSDRVYIQEVILGFGEYHNPSDKVTYIIIGVLAAICCVPCVIYAIFYACRMRKRKKQRIKAQLQRMRRIEAANKQNTKHDEVDDIERQKQEIEKLPKENWSNRLETKQLKVFRLIKQRVMIIQRISIQMTG